MALGTVSTLDWIAPDEETPMRTLRTGGAGAGAAGAETVIVSLLGAGGSGAETAGAVTVIVLLLGAGGAAVGLAGREIATGLGAGAATRATLAETAGRGAPTEVDGFGVLETALPGRDALRGALATELESELELLAAAGLTFADGLIDLTATEPIC